MKDIKSDTMPMIKIQNPILLDTTKVLLIALVFAQGPGCYLGWALIERVKWCKRAARHVPYVSHHMCHRCVCTGMTLATYRPLGSRRYRFGYQGMEYSGGAAWQRYLGMEWGPEEQVHSCWQNDQLLGKGGIVVWHYLWV